MLTDLQRKNRRKYLGSSDAAAILGVDPWKSSADVYWDKIKPPSDNPSEPHSDALIVGNLCEGAVLDWFSKETGKKILRSQRRVHENKIMAANFDALVVGENEAVEAKTAGVVSPLNRDIWGEVGTDQVPDHIIVQCQHQMAILPEIEIVWVPVLLGGIGFRMYRVDRNANFIEDLECAEVDFWKKYVELKTPPPDLLPTIETIKKIQRVPNKTVLLEDSLISNWLAAKEAAGIADKAKEEAQRAVLSALGDADAGECSLGVLTYFEQVRKEYVVKESKSRVTRFKAFKKEAA